MTRGYDDKDYWTIHNMLLSEDVKTQDMGFVEDDTRVWEEDGIVKGFFTLSEAQGHNYLLHFFIDKKYRNMNTYRNLLRECRGIAKKRFFGKMIICVPSEGKDYIQKLVHYMFGGKPYGQSGLNKYIFVEA